MKALRFERKPVKYAAAAVAGRVVPGRGATVGPLSLRDVDEPALPADGWVRFRPRLAGICGSDLATIDGRSSRYFEPIVSFPFVPGHEVVGELDDGSRAVLVPVLTCATRDIDPPCRSCATGAINHCQRIAFGHLEPGLQSGFCKDTGGGWSTAMVAHSSQLVPVPDDLSDEAAVLVEPTACAVHAARMLGDATTVAVIGAGTLGLLTIAALRRYATVGTLVATAKHPEQRRLAKELGADRVVAPGELGRAVRSITGAFVLGDEQLTDGVECVVDCVGSAASIAQGLQVVEPGGEVLLVGMPGHTALDLTGLWHRESAIRGCYAYDRDDFDRALSLVAESGLDRLLSATYPLDRYTEAIEHAANAGTRGAVKIAFDLRNERRR
ncbi:MAG: Zinc-binding alcohol dehydrogenase [Acidimicrobiales bacterium]|nr:Zinc-binding alcohol dehydrogenase [Acidimicrobiales bacterium]